MAAGIQAALQVGAFTADAVALEARKAADTDSPPAVGTSGSRSTNDEPAPVRSLTEQRLSHLPSDTRPAPTVDHYDQLLRHSKETS